MTQALTRWIARQNQLTRRILWFLAITGTIFPIGFVIGVVASSIDKGRIPPLATTYVALAIAVAMTTCGLLLINVLRQAEPPTTPYEQRYNRSILTIGAIGGLVGLTLALAKLGGGDEPEKVTLDWLLDPSAFQSISPPVTVAATALLVFALGAAFTWYHRIIDDHEERSVLWGSTLSYYFMLIAVPCWLLLAAGGLLPPMTGIVALCLILFGTLVQAAVWAWLKYR